MATSQQEGRGIWEWDIVKYSLLFAIGLYAAGFTSLGFTEEGNRAAIAWSAKISFVLFIMAFSASAVQKLFKNSLTFWWRMNRKYFGITFAINHLLHLGLLILLQQVFHPVFTLEPSISLLGGGITYLFIVLMLLTSFEAFSKYLTKKQWLVLHSVGAYTIWVLFLSIYGEKVANVGVEFLPFVLILIVVLIIRLIPKK